MKPTLFFGTLLVALPLLFGVHMAQAQMDPHLIPPESAKIAGCNFMTGEFSYNCIPLYVAYIVKTILSFLGTLALIQIIYAGYEIAIGSLEGDKEKGKKRLKNSIMGLLAAIFSFAIVDMILAVVL